ncbi:hypothetical protein VW41_05320 [Klebsiella michiganensis]|nr:hypothetical protein VW41_05320 [Klebsiella michiganensis]
MPVQRSIRTNSLLKIPLAWGFGAGNQWHAQRSHPALKRIILLIKYDPTVATVTVGGTAFFQYEMPGHSGTQPQRK